MIDLELLKKAEQRFWSKVDKTNSAQGCWTWRGALIRGVPIFYVYQNGKRRGISATRVARRLDGGSIPDRVLIGRTCGNQLCINPEHGVAGKRSAPMEKKPKFILDYERAGYTYEKHGLGVSFSKPAPNLPYPRRGGLVPCRKGCYMCANPDFARQLPKMSDVSPESELALKDTLWMRAVSWVTRALLWAAKPIQLG